MFTLSQCLPINESDFLDIPDVRFYDEYRNDNGVLLGFNH